MASYSSKELIAKIEGMITKYAIWTIGITQKPNTRKQQHGNPKYWHIWKTNNLTAAQNTESHFINKGMKGGTGGDLHDSYITYAYIF